MITNEVNVNWIMLWKCNFRCIYCDTYLNTNALEYQPFEKIKRVFNKLVEQLQKQNDKIHLTITGGEPSIYPNFFDIVKYFVEKIDSLTICTNLSFDVKKFYDICKDFKERINIHPTFHPSCMEIEKFMNNITVVKPFLQRSLVNVVCDKYNMKEINSIVQQLNDKGVKVNLLPFKYTTEKIKETENIKEEELSRLEILNDAEELTKIEKMKQEQNLDLSEYESGKKSPFGKKCLTGYKFLQIFPNGNIRRCSMDNTYLGNIFDEDYQLYTRIQSCKQQACRYEFHNIIED